MALLHVDFFSDVLGMCTPMEGKRGDGKYPTLYLLHGMSDDQTIWQRRTSIERYASEHGIAVVMPTTQLGWYTDMHIGFKWWTFLSQELPAICRSFFPYMSDRREDTFAAGLSMGGYGALKCGLLAPETFSAVASLSGGVDAVEIASNDAIKGNDGLFFDIFGPADKVKGSDNDLFAVAERLAKRPEMMPKIYMWCGTEDFLYQSNLRMRDHLRALGYDLTYEECPGDHQWKYWDAKIQTVLDWLPIKL